VSATNGRISLKCRLHCFFPPPRRQRLITVDYCQLGSAKTFNATAFGYQSIALQLADYANVNYMHYPLHNQC